MPVTPGYLDRRHAISELPLITAPHGASLRRDQHLKDVRFLETLQATLAGCGSETAVYSAAVHRVAAAFDAETVCLAAYDPIADTLEILHQARAKRAWEMDVLVQAVATEHTVDTGAVLAVPIVAEGSPDAGPGAGTKRRPWGVLAIARSGGDTTRPETTPLPDDTASERRRLRAAADRVAAELERQRLRAAADRIAAELERRRVYLLDDVLDGLLRKTKPIDVYTHTLRELRRFIRYDHSASIMTMQRGMAQITVRVEKVVSARGEAETLVDSPRRGNAVRLTTAQTRYLSRLDRAVVLTNEHGWRLAGGQSDPDAAGLWRVLCLDGRTAARAGEGEGAILCYPLIFGGQILGILRLAARRPRAFDPLDQYPRLLDRFARLLSVTLYRSELYHQSDQQLEAIKEIGRVITQPMPVAEICHHVLELALRVLHVQVGAIGLLTNEGRLELVAHHGSTLAQPPVLTLGEGISGKVVQAGTSWAVPDVTAEPAYVALNGRVCSELVAPIVYDREVIGFLDVESFEEGRFREEDEEVITFLEALANQAAIAIKAAQLRTEAVERLGASMAIDPKLSMAGLQDLLIDELRDKIEQLAAANEELAAANRAKSEFLAHMSHDLRGPLNVIVGLANLLADPAVAPALTPDKQQESLELIRANGELLGSLIGNILDLSAVEAGKARVSVAPFDAAPAFEYLRAVAQALARESHKELDVSVAIDPAVTRIIADEEKFLRIMYNLVTNAVKFTPSGGRIEITARVDVDPGYPMNGGAREVPAPVGASLVGAPPLTQGRTLHVAVSDTGIGIAAGDHERVFQAFQQIDGSGNQYHGTGLGLTVVRQLVGLHGGRVWLDSAPGQGSTFHVVLPNVLDPDVGAPLVGDQDGHTQRTGHPQGAPLRPTQSERTVLVIEDIPAHMNMMRLAVTSRGYAVYGAGSGAEALAWLADHRPDVILLDMQLPDMDGFRVAERIKGRVETASIPVIAVTADVLTGTEDRARAAGCDAYLTKPIDIATLLATLDEVGSRQ